MGRKKAPGLYFYHEDAHMMEELLSDEQIGRVFIYAMAYAETGHYLETIELNKTELAVFNRMAGHIDEEVQKQYGVVEARRSAGKRSAEVRAAKAKAEAEERARDEQEAAESLPAKAASAWLKYVSKYNPNSGMFSVDKVRNDLEMLEAKYGSAKVVSSIFRMSQDGFIGVKNPLEKLRGMLDHQ